ncbi:hypothetical protein A2U01_0119504, partial [Trifolium medium]|nr:hypothetical protein [Trifolium medium]
MDEIRKLLLSKNSDEDENSSHSNKPSKDDRCDGPQQHYATRISMIVFP